MNSAEYVAKLIETEKSSGKELSAVAWDAAMACVGWAYVFGARGQYCTPSNRRSRYSDSHPTIKSACKNYNGSSSENCKGCKWYPNEKLTRFFDCRGFTYWILKQVYGWELVGAGATSQWNDAKNWKAKGPISTIPKNTLVCLFVQKGKTMEHTGFGLNNETIECSAGVQHFTQRKSKWTHWGIPACVTGETPVQQTPTNQTRPTLKRGSKGAYVTLAQTELLNKGYNLGKCGIDGDYGPATEAAVKTFQRDNGLVQDGIIGAKTWEKLDSSEPVKLYTATIKNLTKTEADEIMKKYPTAIVKED